MSTARAVLDAIRQRAEDPRAPYHHGPCSAPVCGSRHCQTARDRDRLLALAAESMRERAFEALQNTSASLPLRERLDAVLVAVGPSIAASALMDAAEAWDGSSEERSGMPVEMFLALRADQIEQEAR